MEHYDHNLKPKTKFLGPQKRYKKMNVLKFKIAYKSFNYMCSLRTLVNNMSVVIQKKLGEITLYPQNYNHFSLTPQTMRMHT